MSESKVESLITQRLEHLTNGKAIVWEKHGQTYRATYKNMVFEIEDSGKNWLEIHSANGHNLGPIMDYQVCRNVEALLDTIKYVEAHGTRETYVDTRTTVLGTVLEVLNQGA